MDLILRVLFDGQAAVVTGAAQGLGRQMAIGLAEMGADIAIADLNHGKAVDTAAAIEGETEVTAVETDVTDEASVCRMVESVTEQLGPVDVLINNAGVVENAPVEETTLESWQRILSYVLL